MNLRILLLLGGQGTRLLPLTQFVPKVMMSIHGKPFLYYLLKAYEKQDVVLSVNHMKEAIKNWCRYERRYYEFIEEPEACGTGGAIRIAEPFMAGKRRFAVVNGDTYIDEDLEDIVKTHNYKKDILTVVYAKDILDNVRRNAGVYIVSQSIFEHVRKPKFINMKDLLDKIPHKVYESKKKYLDIGTFEGLSYAKKRMFKGKRWETG